MRFKKYIIITLYIIFIFTENFSFFGKSKNEEKKICDLEKRISELEKRISELEKKISELEKVFAEFKKKIDILNIKIEDLDKFTNNCKKIKKNEMIKINEEKKRNEEFFGKNLDLNQSEENILRF